MRRQTYPWLFVLNLRVDYYIFGEKNNIMNDVRYYLFFEKEFDEIRS